MEDKKTSKEPGGQKAAFLMLRGEGSQPLQPRGIPTPKGGWMPGVEVRASELNLTNKQAKKVAEKHPDLFKYSEKAVK